MMNVRRQTLSSAEWYQTLFDSCADAILVMEDNRFIDCNEAACRMLGADSKADVLGTEPWEISPELQPDGTLSAVKQAENLAIAMEHGTHRFDWKHRRLDGTTFPVEVVLTVLSRGSHTYLHASWRDTSEREQLELELRHSQKLDTVGKLVGGVAHDFNNQLMPIVGYSELLQSELRDSPQLLEYVEWINKAAHHSAELVNRLMAFSRKDTRETEVSNLTAVVYQLSEMMHQLIGEDVVFSLESSAAPLRVNLSQGDIEQIVLNLISNARDAIDSGGKITLSVLPYDYDSEPEALLTIQDNGCGMDRETVERVFEPFFTTKGLGSGTGLGLASVYSLVKGAGGNIHVDSAPGAGTVVRISLPLAQGKDAKDAAAQEADEASRAGRPRDASKVRLLVVEDDISAGALLRTALEEEGFQVTLAKDGLAGLRAADDETFDLLISDVIMPDMSGPALVRELKARGKFSCALYMSGYADGRLQAQNIDSGETPLLRKPFTPSELIDRIWQTLDDCSPDPDCCR